MGEAPGAKEDEVGLPFQGGSGQLLNQMLGRARIDRDRCFLTNVCHVRPPNNEFGWFLKRANEHLLVEGMEQLRKDITEIQPNLVIGLGGFPLQVLTGRRTISKWRGSILESVLVPGQKVISTFHPAAILRTYDYKAITEFDLLRCAEESRSPQINLPQRTFLLPTNSTESERRTVADELSRADLLSLDIECYSTLHGWKLACVGFSDRPDRALVLNCDNASDMLCIRALCENDIPKVMQNGTFDYTVLESHGIIVRNFYWDTMVGHHSLYAECATGSDEMAALFNKKRQAAFSKGLAFQTSIYTREPFYKDDGKTWRETNDYAQFYRYNALDAAVTCEIYHVQLVDLQSLGSKALQNQLSSMNLVMPLQRMTQRGLRIDLEKRSALREETDLEQQRLQLVLDALAGEPVNVKSGPQMQKLLYIKFGLPVKTKKRTKKDGTETNTPTADMDAVTELAAKHGHPGLLTILAIRERRDLIERYFDAKLDPDNRMRCSWDLTGTKTARLASRQSLSGSGTNLQTIPESVREMFIPDDGMAFVYRDYSQAEARVVAYLARCQGLIDLFNDPTRDIHKENAARIFGKPVGDVTPTERYLAKRVVHASNYGMEADKLVVIVNRDAEQTKVSINKAQAQMLIDSYFGIYPELKQNFWSDVRHKVQITRRLETPFGRVRNFYGRMDHKLLLDAYSWIPQSTIGDLCRQAMPEIEIAIKPWGGQLLLNVHDSILVQCPIDQVHRVATLMEKTMDIPITIHGETFHIPTDCKVGFNWANKRKDGTNPSGLVDIEHWVAP